jgi:hypothetical protein
MSELTHKQSNVGFSGVLHELFITTDHGTVSSFERQTVTSKTALDTLDGVKNPYWRSIIRAGGNATTGATGTRYKGQPPFITAIIDATHFSGTLTQHAEVFGNPAVASYPTPDIGLPSDVVTRVTNRALSKFIADCNSKRSSIEAGQDLGELKQSIEAILNPLGSLRQHVLGYFSSVKKLKRSIKHVPSLKKALADTYLEWTFGWNPLVSDIAQGYVGLQNANNVFPTYPVNGHATESFNGTNSIVNSGNAALDVYLAVKSVGQFSVRYKGSMRTGSVGGQVSSAQVLQLQLPDFLPTAWDLLPYSFIADYFVNIGDIVSAVAFRTSDLAWLCKTVRTSTTRTIGPLLCKSAYQPPQYTVNTEFIGGGSSSLTGTLFQRSAPEPSSLIPTLQFNLPLRSKPWVNMGAIMASSTRGLVPLWK